MSVVVLNPQDCLNKPLYTKTLNSHSPMKQLRNPNNRSNSRTQPNRRKRSPSRPNNASPPPPPTKSIVEKPNVANLVLGRVKILKRGEELKESPPSPPSQPSPKVVAAVNDKKNRRVIDLDSAGLLGPNPESVQTRSTRSSRVPGFYAGSSACIASPPPSSLPLPAFFSKKSVGSINNEATSVLLKVLRLDLA